MSSAFLNSPDGDGTPDLAFRLPEVLARCRAWLPWAGFALAALLFAVTVPFGFVRVWILDAPPLGWAQWGSGLAVALATLLVLPRWARPRHVAAAGLGAATIVVAVSLAVLMATPPESVLWPAITYPELFGLPLLALLAVRRCPGWPAAAVVPATTAAVASTPLLRDGSEELVGTYLALLLIVAAVSTGLLLRVMAAARAQQLAQARREERFALARDVHDTVAHHMTGIIVQAQASRHVAERDPTAATRALEEIEQASTEALTAMRRVVAMLREDNTSAPREPTDLRAALQQLANPVSHPPVFLTLHDDPDAPIPPEVSSTVLRIAQESLANARRHAHASRIDVETRLEEQQVTLDINDDGRAGSPPTYGHGYGLEGLAERVDTLGGDFTAGPSQNGGWHVHARLPLRQEPR